MCGNEKNPPPQNGDLNPRPILSKNSFEPIYLYKKFEREREREREREGGGLVCVLALRKLFFPTKHKTQNPTRICKEKRTLRLEVSFSQKTRNLKKISKLALAEKLNIFLNVSDFPRSH